MKDFSSKWKCGPWTPLKAAAELLRRYGKSILVDSSYREVRNNVRPALKQFCTEFGITGTHRFFTSAVIAEACNLARVTIKDVETYAEEDVSHYRQACRDKHPTPSETVEDGEAVASYIHDYIHDYRTTRPDQEAYMPLPEGAVKVNITNVDTTAPEAVRLSINAWARQFGKQSMILKEQQMALNTNKLIESRIFINGIDASTLSDDAIFQAIAKAEHDIKELEMIDNKPVKLIKKLDKARKSIIKVLRYVDAR